jgi:hypothetical protein
MNSDVSLTEFSFWSEDNNTEIEEDINIDQYIVSNADDKEKEKNIIDDYCYRLKRRNELIGIIRKAYLKDVVTIKHIIQDVLTKNERVEVWHEYNTRLPSLRLDLFSPLECYFEVKPCIECGGTLEIVHRESEEIMKLSKLLAETRTQNEVLRITNAELNASIENSRTDVAKIKKERREEVICNVDCNIIKYISIMIFLFKFTLA